METWVNSIKNDDILVTYDTIVNFIKLIIDSETIPFTL